MALCTQPKPKPAFWVIEDDAAPDGPFTTFEDAAEAALKNTHEENTVLIVEVVGVVEHPERPKPVVRRIK